MSESTEKPKRGRPPRIASPSDDNMVIIRDRHNYWVTAPKSCFPKGLPYRDNWHLLQEQERIEEEFKREQQQKKDEAD